MPLTLRQFAGRVETREEESGRLARRGLVAPPIRVLDDAAPVSLGDQKVLLDPVHSRKERHDSAFDSRVEGNADGHGEDVEDFGGVRR